MAETNNIAFAALSEECQHSEIRNTFVTGLLSKSLVSIRIQKGFPDGSAGKESACRAGDTGYVGSVPGLRRSPGGGNDNPLQYSCLENPMARGAWLAAVHGVAKSQTQQTEQSTAHLHKETRDACLTKTFSIIMYRKGIQNEETVFS